VRTVVDLDEQAVSRHEPDAPSLVPDSTPVIAADSLGLDADSIADHAPPVLGLGPLRPRRSVARRVTERVILAVLALALLGGLEWTPDAAFGALGAALFPAAKESQDAPAKDDTAAVPQAVEPEAVAPTAVEPNAGSSWFTRDLLMPLPPSRAAASTPPSAAPAARVPIPRPRQ
jgi:hypothetical protein